MGGMEEEKCSRGVQRPAVPSLDHEAGKIVTVQNIYKHCRVISQRKIDEFFSGSYFQPSQENIILYFNLYLTNNK